MMDEQATALVQTVIWTLRICLPILLFLLYYRVPFPDFLPKKHRHQRQKLLELRPPRGAPPTELANLGLVGQSTHPQLFVQKKRGGKGAEKESKAGDETQRPLGSEKMPQTDMLHLESLLNYMAFNRKSHRIFHPLHPPPPPSAPPPPNNAAPSADFQEKANLDAQMVLQGALMFKKLDVVTDVYESLTNTKVTPSEKTFTLMVEVCIAAHDLPKASDFLMKMEQCGHSPCHRLLDRVMELYAQHKVTAELGQRLNAEKHKEPGTELGAGLSADAPEFVPTAMGDDSWQGDWNWWEPQAWTPWNEGKGKGKKEEKGWKGGKDWKGKDDWRPKSDDAKGAKGKGWNDNSNWTNGWNADWSKEKSDGKGKKGGKQSNGKGKAHKETTTNMPEQKAKKNNAVWRKKEGENAEES